MISYIDARYPHANDFSQGDGVNTGGYRFTTPTPDNQSTYVGRVDYNLTHAQRLFARFTITRRNAINVLPEFPTDPLTHPFTDDSYGYVVSHVWTLGSNKVNQFYYGDTISRYDFPDLNNPTGPNQYSFTGFDGPFTVYDGQKRRIPVPEVRDDFNWQRGAHSFTFGGTFKFVKTESNHVNNFNFVEGGLTGYGLSGGLSPSLRPSDIAQGGAANASNVAINDYDNLYASALGLIGEIATNYNYNNSGAAQPEGTGNPTSYRFFETEAYFGDTWKATRKLTLSYGVRYQFYSVPYEVHGLESVPNPIDITTYMNQRIAQSNAGDTTNTGLPLFTEILAGNANHGPQMYAPSYKDFAPRVAFTYSPFGSRGTVVNASAGIVYDRTVINAVNFLQDQSSLLFANQQTNQFESRHHRVDCCHRAAARSRSRLHVFVESSRGAGCHTLHSQYRFNRNAVRARRRSIHVPDQPNAQDPIP